jgi:membrane protein implicated in regulation of membrane protease activity
MPVVSASDVTIFQLLAAVFTLSFIVLIFFIWRFIRNLDLTRQRMHAVAGELEEGLRPILADLRSGAFQGRVRGEQAPSRDEAMSMTPPER